MSLLLSAGFQVQITYFLQKLIDFLLKSNNLALDNIWNLNFFGGQDLIENGADISTIDMCVIMFCEILDELHDLNIVSIGLNPNSKLGVFCFNLIDKVDEHVVHLVLHVVEIRGVEGGIVVDMGFDLRPLYFAAPFME
jgi:hypothetical protein